MAGYVAFTGDFYLLSTFGLIHEGLEASKSSCWHFFISQLMFQKSETPELSKAWKLVKIQMCGLRISHFFPKSSQPIFIIKLQFPTTYKFTVASSLVQCKLPSHTHTLSVSKSPTTHNSLSTLICLLIRSHFSWHCLLALCPFLPQYSKQQKKQVPLPWKN